MYDYPIVDYALRYGINLIPSFKIVDNEENEFIILDPKTEALRLLNKIKKIGENELLHSLTIFYSNEICISTTDLLSDTDKDAYEINVNDLVKQSIKEGYFDSEREALAFCMENFPPKLRIKSNEILNLKNEKVCLIPTENNIDLIKNNKIKNIIYNKKTSNEIIDVCTKNNINLVYGSGSFMFDVLNNNLDY